MYSGSLVFAQIMQHLPRDTFRRCVSRYGGDRYVKAFTCADQYRCMAFAQLTCRSSLRDIEACLRAQSGKSCHMGIRVGVSRNNLANANQGHDWRIHADFAQHLIHIARDIHADDTLPGLDVKDTVYALDSSTIDLCLSLFPWARVRKTKGAVKLHTLLDLHGNIPAFIHMSDGKLHDVNVLDMLVPDAGAFYVMDRAYLDFERLHLCGSFFVLRAKSNTRLRRLSSRPVDRTTGRVCDQVVRPDGVNKRDRFPGQAAADQVSRPGARQDPGLPDQQLRPAGHDSRRHLPFEVAGRASHKWIKQHLRIKSFFGTTENAVKSQIWIAVSVYVTVAIIRKRLNIEESLHTILQILSLTIFEKNPLNQLLETAGHQDSQDGSSKQLNLFDFQWDSSGQLY